MRAEVESKIADYLGASILALAGVLVVEIDNDSNEAVEGLNRAALAAIRPRLVGVIAEDADRVLAQEEEAAR